MYLRFRNAIENVNVIIVTWLAVAAKNSNRSLLLGVGRCELRFSSSMVCQVNVCSEATYNDASMGDLQARPELGNVAFGSGLHGWGFSIETFGKILSAKTGMAPWEKMAAGWFFGLTFQKCLDQF